MEASVSVFRSNSQFLATDVTGGQCGISEANEVAPEAFLSTVQVVAGINYALLLKTSLSCLNSSGPEVDNVTIAAIVYQPPANVDPQVGPLPLLPWHSYAWSWPQCTDEREGIRQCSK